MATIANIFSTTTSSDQLPSRMTTVIVKPLPKLFINHRQIGNYRAVSNLSFISKSIENVVLQQIVHYLNHSILLCMSQSAYRTSHTTETLFQIY